MSRRSKLEGALCVRKSGIGEKVKIKWSDRKNKNKKSQTSCSYRLVDENGLTTGDIRVTSFSLVCTSSCFYDLNMYLLEWWTIGRKKEEEEDRVGLKKLDSCFDIFDLQYDSLIRICLTKWKLINQERKHFEIM